MNSVLVVDDELPILDLYRDILEPVGFTVFTAKDGLEGLMIATERQPNVVLLDYKLPRMDGFEVLSHISSRKISTRVIMISWADSASIIVKAMKLGACDFISKPIDPDELIFRVRKAIELDYTIKMSLENNNYVMKSLTEEVRSLKEQLKKCLLFGQKVSTQYNELREKYLRLSQKGDA